jgi:hypothetical protein
MPQLSNRTLAVCTLTLAIACATNDTSNQALPNTGGTGGGGGTAGTTATAGTGGTSVGSSGAGAGGTAQAGTGGTTGGTGGTPAVGGFAGTPAGGGGAGGGGAGGGGAGGGGAGGGGAGGGGAGGGGAGGGGNGGGGTGGVAAVDPCDRTKWTASALPTSGANPAAQAIDVSTATRWSSGQDEEPGDYFQVLFPALVNLDGVTLVSNAANDFPVGYKVQYTTDGTTFQDMMADDGGTLTGAGAVSTPTVITLDSTLAVKGLRIVLTANGTYWWSIYNLTAQGCVEYVAADAGVDGG